MFKLVSFDMDGTFLNSQHDYDRKRFAQLFPQLKEKGIKVVANSGNQYQQIASFFTDYLEDMVIVSEIGTQIYEKGERIYGQHFERSIVEEILTLLAEKKLLHRASVAGFQSLYLEKSADTDFKSIMARHNQAIIEIESLLSLPDDQFTLITLDIPQGDIAELVDELNILGQGQVRAVSSGFHFIDIALPHVDKSTALAYLGQKWQIEPADMIAFGDSDNDLEMLIFVGGSYAMEGSPESVIAAATHLAPSNDASGVLQVLEQELKNEQNSEK